ncbi:MAG: outer membrane protein assembly factor BamD [Verrucomicrobiaceae bacterium]
MSFLKTASLTLLAGLLCSCSKNLDSAQLASTVKASQGSAKALYDQGRAAESAGKTKSAIKIYRKVTREYPLSDSSADAKFRQAHLLDQSGELIDAFEAYNELLARYPASPHYSTAIKRQEALAHAAAGGTLKTGSFLGLKGKVEAKKSTAMLAKVRANAPRSTSGEKAQFTIGEVWQNKGDAKRAIDAYRELVREYPESNYAHEAQYRIGAILLAESKDNNQDQANLSRAREAFDDVILRYPNSKRAKDARREITKLGSRDIQSSYDIAEFYRKKGNTTSALLYYREVVKKSQPGPLRTKAQAWVAKLGG